MASIDTATQRYAFLALLAAALFGASTPIAKTLIGSIPPTLLAGLLYMGSGLGLLIVWLLTRKGRNEALPKGSDWFWLAGAVLTGGIVAPVLLIHGLAGSAAGTASLLLNFESVFTSAIAGLAFREAVGRRVWLAAGVMLLAAGLLGYDPSAQWGYSASAALVVAACLMWAVDNNLTRRVSSSDAVFLALFKGLVAGAVNIGLATARGASFPTFSATVVGLVVGFLGYGVSLVLFILALRHLGSARAGSHFATAPFFGCAIAVLVLGDPLTSQFLLAAGMMSVATYLVLSEDHEHVHTHQLLSHEHRHVHDEHHQHVHRGDEGPEPHSHPHAHEPLTHSHKHLPDIHHRHSHQ